jgi:hypothetical protein
MGLKATHIIIEPTTPRGKYQICRLNIGGTYHTMCECHAKSIALKIVSALTNDEFTGSIVASMRQAAE